MKVFENKHYLSILIVILLVGVFLRFYHLGRESFWLDEGASVRLSRLSPAGIAGEAAGHFHPPLYFFILRGWVELFGDSEFPVRALSALFGAGSIAIIYLLGSLLFGRRQGFLAAGLLCLSKFNLFYSQEARMYSLLAFLALCSMLFFARMLKKPGRLDWLGYLVSTAFVLYTHNFGIFVVAVQNVFIVLSFFPRGRRSSIIAFPRWLLLQIVLLVLYSPWLKVTLNQMAMMPDSPWSVARPVPETLVYSLLQFSGSEILKWLFIILGLFALGAALAGRGKRKGPGDETAETFSQADGVALALLWLALPLLGAFLISQYSVSVFVHRATIISSLPLYLLAAVGLNALPGRLFKAAAIAAVGLLAFLSLGGYYGRTYKDQWRATAELIAERGRRGDLVICAPLSPFKNVFFYYFERAGMEDSGIAAAGFDFDPGNAAGTLPPLVQRPRAWLILSHQAIADLPLITETLQKDYEVTFTEKFINGSNVPFHPDRVGLVVCLLEKRIEPGLSRPEEVERFSLLLRDGRVPNILRDPGFEEGGESWGAEPGWIDRAGARSGRASVRLAAETVSAPDFWRLKQGPIRLAASQAYIFGAFVKTIGLKNVARIEIKEFNSLERHPYFSTSGISGDNDWTVLIGVFRPRPRAGAEETEIEIRAGRVVDFSAGEFWVDDVFLIPAADFPGRDSPPSGGD